MAKKPVEVIRQATLSECNALLHANMLEQVKNDAAKKGSVIREVVYMPAPTNENVTLPNNTDDATPQGGEKSDQDSSGQDQDAPKLQ